MRLGIIGLPQCGKTTLFNAFTRGSQPTGSVSGKIEVHTAVVDVPDARVDKLVPLFKPKKTVYAKVTYADIAGLDGSAGKAGIAGNLLNQLTQMDGFIHVVRVFENDNVPHLSGSVDRAEGFAGDGQRVYPERFDQRGAPLERLDEERRKGGGRDKLVVERDIVLFQRFHQALGEEIPLRDWIFPKMKSSRGWFWVSDSKTCADRTQYRRKPAEPEISYHHKSSKIVSLKGKLEMEIAQLPGEEDSCSWMIMKSKNRA